MMELQIKITSPLLGWLLSKRQQIRSVGQNVEKLESLCSFDGNVQSLWKTIWSSLKKKKSIEGPYDSAVPLLALYPKELKLTSQRGVYFPMFTAALFIIAKI